MSVYSTKRLAVTDSGERADRPLCIKTNANASNQRFWVVAVSGMQNAYKIVPLSSAGTMALTNRTNSSDTFVNQYYTSDQHNGDVWYLDPYVVINGTGGEPGYDRLSAWLYASENAVLPDENNEESPDCTNFASHCLRAGGLGDVGFNLINNDDYDQWFKATLRTSNTWVNANLFTKHWGKASNRSGSLEGYMRGYKMIEFAGHATAIKNWTYIESVLNDGDMIGLRWIGGTNDSKSHHTMVVYSVGSTIEYAQHSSNKIGDLKQYLEANPNALERMTFLIISA